MLHIPPTNCLLLTAKQEPYEKAYLLTKNTEEFSEKKFRKKGQQAEKDKTERVTRLGLRTREEIAKWNQMTALRFQTGGRHQTSLASLRFFFCKTHRLVVVHHHTKSGKKWLSGSGDTEWTRSDTWTELQMDRRTK